jgi:DNA-binding CsgD family transcriptional regulator
MRKWIAPSHASAAAPPSIEEITALVETVGTPGFAAAVLDTLQTRIPAGTWNAYRVGTDCAPQLYLSASHGVADCTVACWRAYLSGPHAMDRSWTCDVPDAAAVQISHIDATELTAEHRERVYDAHGMAERLSVSRQHCGGGVLALNFYRHLHQRPFRDAQIAELESLAPLLLALARKHLQIVLAEPPQQATAGHWRSQLQANQGTLTERELDVCSRILAGLSLDGIASDLGISLTTVKTYRQRAFDRMGIHFRNELFARVSTGRPAVVI